MFISIFSLRNGVAPLLPCSCPSEFPLMNHVWVDCCIS
uniref:Uncharacterized protein n=1 Tax=Rhizophora mucronata TaxID=61149 RepID=A0A2P2KKX5_RHIMU